MTLELPSDIPSSIPSGSKIYKDDCMYSFDTPENNQLGIDIDLKTYKAYSRNKSYNYTKENYEKTGNSLYLNIKKTLKPQEERNKLLYDDNGEKNAKLQKLEIKNVSDDDYYNTEITIYDITQDRSYPRSELSPQFNELIDTILSSNSSATDDEIKQWQQEIVPCPHSIDVEQFDNDNLDLTKCNQCELKENLWICLHCGILGCGRQQYGSALKGNGHALSHYELTQHPVAIKLGSLSADSESCDAYCYQCNDEVKVPNLAAKLHKFGIDLNSAVKTEKSLIELNIDQNLNWDFKLDGANGEKLPPVYGKGLTGFQNLGNSCYLNSVIQALFTLKGYQRYFDGKTYPNVANPADDLVSQLIKIYDGLFSGRYSVPGSLKGDDYQLGIKPSAFKTLIGENHPEFKTQRQQDAFEFLLYFLDKVDNQLGLQLNEELKFLQTNKVLCGNCFHGTLTNDLVDNISVPIETEVLGKDEDGKKIYKEIKLIDSFKEYTSEEAIEDYHCENCKESTLALKTIGFKSFPGSLIVNVQRIKLENWAPIKVDVPIEIPYTLDLSEFKAPKFEDGEVEIKKAPEESSENVFTPIEEALNTLLGMGFPEPRCLKALFNTGNNNAEEAMNWIFAHMDDADIDDPFIPTPTQETSSGPSDDLIENVTAMGFSHQLAKKALILNNNDVSAAVEWLFNNPDDNGIIEETGPVINVNQEKSDLIEKLESQALASGKYELQSVICHKGTSPHTGHYVVFIKKLIDDEYKWVLFNDEKVVICDEDNLQDIKNNGYVYIFKQT
ncbi:UBP14 Ubiquitin carboxyl-terminal hydrolase 14 [Candida maltosa Xu316]